MKPTNAPNTLPPVIITSAHATEKPLFDAGAISASRMGVTACSNPQPRPRMDRPRTTQIGPGLDAATNVPTTTRDTAMSTELRRPYRSARWPQ
eukprot:scaffold2940_cov63-Phaeocystis_antarctica.AAC.3